MPYNFVIKHVPGANNSAADALSWHMDLEFTDEEMTNSGGHSDSPGMVCDPDRLPPGVPGE